VSGPEMSLIISPVDFGGFFMKPSGFWRTVVKCLSKAEWILANVLPSRVDSRKCFTKPSGFSQMFYQAGWILANVLPSRVDSRKSCTKPSGFGRNLLRNRVDFRQTFISQTDSLQVFLLSKVLMSPVFFRMLVVTPVKVIDGISFRVLVVTPVKVIDGISLRMLVVTPVKVIDGISFRVLVVTPVKVIDGISLQYVGHYLGKGN